MRYHLTTLMIASLMASILVYAYIRPIMSYGLYKQLGWRSFFENPVILIRDTLASTFIVITVAVLWEWMFYGRRSSVSSSSKDSPPSPPHARVAAIVEAEKGRLIEWLP